RLMRAHFSPAHSQALRRRSEWLDRDDELAPSRWDWGSTRRQAETVENLPYRIRRMNRRDDSHPTLTTRTFQNVQGPYTFHELSPGIVPAMGRNGGFDVRRFACGFSGWRLHGAGGCFSTAGIGYRHEFHR